MRLGAWVERSEATVFQLSVSLVLGKVKQPDLSGLLGGGPFICFGVYKRNRDR